MAENKDKKEETQSDFRKGMEDNAIWCLKRLVNLGDTAGCIASTSITAANSAVTPVLNRAESHRALAY